MDDDRSDLERLTDAEFALAHDEAFWARVAESADGPFEPLADDFI